MNKCNKIETVIVTEIKWVVRREEAGRGKDISEED